MNTTFFEKKDQLKELFKQLRGEEDRAKVDELKARFKNVLSGVDSETLAYAEQELAGEGFTLQDLRSACDVHLELMSEALSGGIVKVPEGSPVARFEIEHDKILSWMRKLREAARSAQNRATFEGSEEDRNEAARLLRKLAEAESHNVRQESAFFPMLERYGITEPPKVMWGEHREMKDLRRELEQLLVHMDAANWKVELAHLEAGALDLVETFVAHTQKEQSVLYPIAMKRFSEADWADVQSACDEIGYFDLTD